ncbi:hypothetical protein [Haloprofundus sp. MHR1]|uniref:hypothetical protein n=1 Tax=Haloprofundus sp. MHR1 TaxID=2572921 RepID=UPI0010BE84AF|nr:hypothetical protein [Haloprofundus sp. MHR1]QCJ47506.1 hypothetical protein FCF25_10425 [Haloprofundus sp. MHR1]
MNNRRETIDEAKRVARTLFDEELTESSDGDSNAESEPFDVERFLRTLAGQDTEQSRERRTGKQLVAGSLVALGVLRRLARDERVERLLAETSVTERETEAEPTPEESFESRSVVGTLLRLLAFAVVVAVVAFAVRKRRTGGDSEPDATERDITETNVAEEDVMGASAAEEADVDEMVDAVEDDEGDISPEPGETVVEDDVVEAATNEDESEGEDEIGDDDESEGEDEIGDDDESEGEDEIGDDESEGEDEIGDDDESEDEGEHGDQTAGEAALETEESDDETEGEESDAESDSGGTEGESPLEGDGEATNESPNQ